VLVDAAGTRGPGVERPDLFMAGPARARELLFADPGSPLARQLVPDLPPPERLEAVLRGREARTFDEQERRAPALASELRVLAGGGRYGNEPGRASRRPALLPRRLLMR